MQRKDDTLEELKAAVLQTLETKNVLSKIKVGWTFCTKFLTQFKAELRAGVYTALQEQQGISFQENSSAKRIHESEDGNVKAIYAILTSSPAAC